MNRVNLSILQKRHILLMSIILFFVCLDVTGADKRLQVIKEDETGKKITVNLNEELVYDLTLFNGKSFQFTFCPEAIDTIYMIAGSANVFQYRKTDVYYWPISKEYMADWNRSISDKPHYTLEVLKGKRIYRRFSLEKYVFEYPNGFQTSECRLYTAVEAQEAYDRYFKKNEEYGRAVIAYYKSMAEYKSKMEKYIKKPGNYNYIPPNEPLAPNPLLESVTEPEYGFILNLPPGKYQIRLINQDEAIVVNSERMLEAFPMLGEGVGYQIIPEDKWTRATTSDDAAGNMFVLPGQTMYLKPFKAIKFNKHHYLKLSKLQSPVSGRGMENLHLWVQVEEISERNLSLEIFNNKKSIAKIEEKPYYVEQRAGSFLGYDIHEYDLAQFPEESPTFSAYKVQIRHPSGDYRLGLVGREGEMVKNSIRIMQPMTDVSLSILVLIAALPLCCGFLVVGLRVVATRRHMKEEIE